VINLQSWKFPNLAKLSQRPHRPIKSLAGFPDVLDALRSLPFYSSLQLSPGHLRRKILVRGRKDALLEDIVETLCKGKRGQILNPCCVFARQAREIATRLPLAEVLASDVDPTWERLFRGFAWVTLRRCPTNFRFYVESIYQPSVFHRPLAVCFFGGCGSLTDAALKLAVCSQASYVVGRACCHENIGMNLQMSTHAFTIWNLGHRAKNRVYGYCAKRFGYYFDVSAAKESYPTSMAWRTILDPDAMLRCARHAVDCRLCQVIIDLDRVAFLEEHGFSMRGYNENMFVAVRGNL
jgi:hypothetical protein